MWALQTVITGGIADTILILLAYWVYPSSCSSSRGCKLSCSALDSCFFSTSDRYCTPLPRLMSVRTPGNFSALVKRSGLPPQDGEPEFIKQLLQRTAVDIDSHTL
jgi:hypothetical protein